MFFAFVRIYICVKSKFHISPTTRKRFSHIKSLEISNLNQVELIQASRNRDKNYDGSDTEFTFVSEVEQSSSREFWPDGHAENSVVGIYESNVRISFDVVKEFEKVKTEMDCIDYQDISLREPRKSGLSQEIEVKSTLTSELIPLLDSGALKAHPKDINPPEESLESVKQNIELFVTPTRSNQTITNSNTSSLPINIELFKKIDQAILNPSFLLDDNSDTETQSDSETETDTDVEVDPEGPQETKLAKALKTNPKALNAFYIRDMSQVPSLSRPQTSSLNTGLNKKRSYLGNLSLESTYSPPRLTSRSNSYPQLAPVKGILTTNSRERLRIEVFGGGFAGKTPEPIGPKREKKSVRFELPSPESSGLEDEGDGEEYTRNAFDIERDDDDENLPKFKEIMFVPEAMMHDGNLKNLGSETPR
ncbi:hypothetical protein HK096_011014 [Nowakowskiella sp. JEL0078]|nr:hypothetical protein HK096_011014 [Nowakowskiella sp. JEL0078]